MKLSNRNKMAWAVRPTKAITARRHRSTTRPNMASSSNNSSSRVAIRNRNRMRQWRRRQAHRPPFRHRINGAAVAIDVTRHATKRRIRNVTKETEMAMGQRPLLPITPAMRKAIPHRTTTTDRRRVAVRTMLMAPQTPVCCSHAPAPLVSAFAMPPTH